MLAKLKIWLAEWQKKVSPRLKTKLSYSMALSVALHIFILFGVGLALPDPRNLNNLEQPLQVVLVNSKSNSKPFNPDALAQANLDGGGNTTEDRRAKSPLPSMRDDSRFVPEQRTKRVAQMEEESKRMMLKLKSDYTLKAPELKKDNNKVSDNGDELVQRALEIARLEAQIDKDWDTYQKMPRRKFIGARTREYRYAQYIESWRIKVERIGNLNYPELARAQKIFGSLQLSVSIRADGSLESVEVSKSSGRPILDAAAVRIVKLAAPYAPLPPNITKDIDILTITRTWTFTSAANLESE